MHEFSYIYRKSKDFWPTLNLKDAEPETLIQSISISKAWTNFTASAKIQVILRQKVNPQASTKNNGHLLFYYSYHSVHTGNEAIIS